MQRYILTGAPGAGKTIMLRRLELEGFGVVEEAATDLIALTTARGVERHWDEPDAIDTIVAMQRRRQERATTWPDEVVFFDRSPICTWALTEFLGREPSEALRLEIERVERERIYERRVFFFELLGSITLTEARRITLEDSRRFGAVHVDAYRRFGYECVFIPPADVEARLQIVLGALS